MTPDNLKNNNQGADVQKPSNYGKDYSKIKWLIIGAIIASVPTIINSFINNSAEDKRIQTQALIVRQNAEIERSKIEIESLITTLSEYSVESGIILKNLMKSNVMTPVNSEYSLSLQNYRAVILD